MVARVICAWLRAEAAGAAAAFCGHDDYDYLLTFDDGESNQRRIAVGRARAHATDRELELVVWLARARRRESVTDVCTDRFYNLFPIMFIQHSGQL